MEWTINGPSIIVNIYAILGQSIFFVQLLAVKLVICKIIHVATDMVLIIANDIPHFADDTLPKNEDMFNVVFLCLKVKVKKRER